jgi:hypothetical protein
MIAVAEVLREREETNFNSDGTAQGTVLSPFQFSGWNTNDPNRLRAAQYALDHPIVVKAITAHRFAFERRSTLAMGANLYHADWMNPYPDWTMSSKVTRLTQIGHHIFYREKR